MTGHAQEASPDLLSVEEYARLRESEEYRSELVRGVLVREPHLESEGLGVVLTDVGVALPGMARTVRGPDLAFWRAGRLPTPLPAGFLEEAPDLAVEILSPSNSASEMLEKVREYLEAGTLLVWVVDPASRTATVYRSRNDIRIVTDDEALDGDDVLPGFRVVLGEVLP